MQITITSTSSFEWDEHKDRENQSKHGVGFVEAQQAFTDPANFYVQDWQHSTQEERWFCVGRIANGIVTVRFTYRAGKIRIFGAGYWRKMRKIYEQKKENQ